MRELIKEVELVAVRRGTYSIYVFRVLCENTFVMCTVLPNWQLPIINVGDKGFLQYQMVKAGDEYVTPDGNRVLYKYTNTYLINFVNKIKSVTKNEEIIL